MNHPLKNYYDKDINSDIIDEEGDAAGVAAGGISPENICSASCNHVQHCFLCVVTRSTSVQSPGFGASPHPELKLCDNWRLEKSLK